MESRVVASWGNVVRERHAFHDLRSRNDSFPDVGAAASVLPYGTGRSYGDSCLNVGGALLGTRCLDRFIHFDRATGELTCEAGVLLAEILQVTVPAGWFLPVVPGTSHVTVGGAIANDVHGKNHHRAGTFGCHVLQLELLRSDAQPTICSATQNPALFSATIGGLGLTGVITWATLQLRRIAAESVDLETIRFANLEEFFGLCEESEARFEYTVAWIDCLGSGRRRGRGLLQRASHAAATAPQRKAGRGLTVPFVAPVPLVNAPLLRAFNSLRYHGQVSKRRQTVQHYVPFFFPLDGIRNWNRLYGPRGFYQYQCVVPDPAGAASISALLETLARNGPGAYLAVLKRFGTVRSPGLLSFPAPGATLALDFPNHSSGCETLFRKLDSIVADCGGRLYPAKDGRMSGDLFRRGYPRWGEFVRHVDPAFSSSFWRRVTGAA